MKLTKCENGHFYDSDKYPECPYCNTDLLRDRSIVRTGEAEQPAAVETAARQGRLRGGSLCWTARRRGAICVWVWAAASWDWTPTARL